MYEYYERNKIRFYSKINTSVKKQIIILRFSLIKFLEKVSIAMIKQRFSREDNRGLYCTFIL